MNVTLVVFPDTLSLPEPQPMVDGFANNQEEEFRNLVAEQQQTDGQIMELSSARRPLLAEKLEDYYKDDLQKCVPLPFIPCRVTKSCVKCVTK